MNTFTTISGDDKRETLRIYYPEGSAAYTDRVAAHEADSHIAGNSWHAREARALKEFRDADGIPAELLGGEYTLTNENMVSEDGAVYAEYVRDSWFADRDRKVTVAGRQVDFDAAVNLMDDELREQLHAQGIESEQAFADAYAEAHAEKFGETFVVA